MNGDILVTVHEAAARDAELFAQAWCHEDHWAATANILQKEASR